MGSAHSGCRSSITPTLSILLESGRGRPERAGACPAWFVGTSTYGHVDSD